MSRTKLPPATQSALHICTACGLLCDDVQLTPLAGGKLAISPPCPVAERRLTPTTAPEPRHIVAGRQATLEESLSTAATLLRNSRAPLVTGLHRATVEAIRHAIALADGLGAIIEPVSDSGLGFDATPAHAVGAVTATLGEVINRADLVVAWFADPDATHPRFRQRIGRAPSPRFVPAGSRRTWLDVGPRGTPATTAESEFDAAMVLRAIVDRVPLDTQAVHATTGVTIDGWEAVAAQLTAAKYVALVYDDQSLAPQATTALLELAAALHRQTRAVAIPLGRPANAVGAMQTLLWQTGFPATVSFAAGYPEYRPHDATVDQLLARGEVDAALVVGADLLGSKSQLSEPARAHLRKIPLVLVDDRPSATRDAAQVAISVPRFELSTAGTVFRTDGVPLPLTAAIPAQEASLESVLARLCALANVNC